MFVEQMFLKAKHPRQGEDWKPPQPEPAAKTPFTNPINILLNDVEKELLVLLSKRPDNERQGTRVPYMPISAMIEFKGALGCVECMRTHKQRNACLFILTCVMTREDPVASSSRTVDLTVEEHP